jgi:hypothetical protein
MAKCLRIERFRPGAEGNMQLLLGIGRWQRMRFASAASKPVRKAVKPLA